MALARDGERVAWADGHGARAHLGLKLLGQQVHQQPVVPVAVGPALVAAHHADGLEADRRVGRDRALVAPPPGR